MSVGERYSDAGRAGIPLIREQPSLRVQSISIFKWIKCANEVIQILSASFDRQLKYCLTPFTSVIRLYVRSVVRFTLHLSF